MSSAPSGPWIDRGFRPEQPDQRAISSRKPLYFLVFASAVLAVTIMAIFFMKLMETGQNTANPGTQTSSSSSSGEDSPSASTGGKLQEVRDAVKKLANNPSCSAAEKDASTIISFAKAAIEENSYESEKKTISDSMSKLSKECGAEYTLELAKAAAKGPSNLADLASSHSWWHLQSPAPSGARDVTEFTTPANNIRCRFDDNKVFCSIYAYDYPSPPGCEGKTATYELAVAGDVKADCVSSYNSSIKLDYGTVVAHDGIWCTADQTQGVTCTSELSGKGFQLRRAGERRF